MGSLLEPHVLLDAVRDESGRIVNFVFADANPAACAYNHRDRDKMLGTRLLDLLPDIAGTDLLKQYGQVLETGVPLVMDDFVNTENPGGGKQRHLDVRVVCVGEGRLLSYSWRHITDRQLAVEAGQRMATIVQYCDYAIASNDSDGLITTWNPAAERMFGYSAEKMIGTSGSILNPTDRSDEQGAVLASVMNEGEHVTDFEAVFIRKNETEIPVHDPLPDPRRAWRHHRHVRDRP